MTKKKWTHYIIQIRGSVGDKMKLFSLLIGCFVFVFKAYSYEYEISACCIFQNEDRFLKEWIDYHQLIGVEHFYMYDNQSTDNSFNVIEPYVKAGIVDYIPWEKDFDTPEEWWQVQREAYIDAVERSTNTSKWLCIIDTDEFIVPIKDYHLKSFLKDYESYGGVCIHWIFYGTSGIQRIPEGLWMVACQLYRAELSHHGHHYVKSVVRPERVDAQTSFFPHTCAYRDDFYHVDPNKREFKRGAIEDIAVDRIRIHHHWSRDIDFLLQHKLPRNRRWHGEEGALNKIREEANMNACFDPIILDIISHLQKPPRATTGASVRVGPA